MTDDEFEKRFAMLVEKTDDLDEIIISVSPLQVNGVWIGDVGLLSLCGGDALTLSADVLERLLNHAAFRRSSLRVSLRPTHTESPNPPERE
jgi:hypothetical protein